MTAYADAHETKDHAMKLCWIDVRDRDGLADALVEEALHQRVDGIVADDVNALADLPPTVSRVLLPGPVELPDEVDAADVVILDAHAHPAPAELQPRHPDVAFGRYVRVADHDSLQTACKVARTDPWSVVAFDDPTKIPLEIVLAAADRADGRLITAVGDVEEAGVVFGVLERGSDGVMLAPSGVGEATKLAAVAREQPDDLALAELEVVGVERVGLGDRACVDTCSRLGEDEGILVGSHADGLVLGASETHPLPYMPTRPFRVNAGALHSYTLADSQRTSYLSELRSGCRVLAVDTGGHTRSVAVGRVKIERRPLLRIDAVDAGGNQLNVIVQDDWHVRVLGPGGLVHNVTELQPGDRLLGCRPAEQRHVGYPIAEFCIEQ